MNYAIEIDGVDYKEVSTLRPGFVIINYQGTMVFASQRNDGKWELWAGSPSAADKMALVDAIEANGGFDKTSLEITPPSDKP
jgi:hypothetical protein